MRNPIFLSQNEDHAILTDAVAAGTQAVIVPDTLRQVSEITLYVVWSGQAHGGQVVIEGAHQTGYQGKWALLKEVSWMEPNRVHEVSLPGTHLAMRVRVSQSVVTGTVSVYGIAN